jgi:hypothetical protein
VAVVLAVTALLLFHRLIIGRGEHYWHQAIAWHINPLIFVGLLLATFYHYYKGWFMIARGLVKKDRATLRRGVALNRLVWAIPYVYVLLFGHGYPWWVPTLLIVWVVVGLALFVRNYRNQTYVDKMINSPFGKLIARRNHPRPKEP